MKTQFFRFVLCSIIANLTYLNLAVTPSLASGENGIDSCRVAELQLDNRRYARNLANLDAGEPRMVRLIYFLPNDQPYRADVVQRMKDQILNIQAFYAEQMNVHGYGKITFRVETDTQGDPIVHRVDGQYPDSYYNDSLDLVFEESERAFNLKAYISLIVHDNSSGSLGGGQAGLGERWGKNSGYAVVTGKVDFGVTAHELGHAFGLEHDFRDGAYIMSYGPGWNRLSSCSAEFLSAHPYFNPDIPIEGGHSPTVELISPRTYPAGSRSVPIRFQVNDSEGLHQVILRGLGGLIACRGLTGETDVLVEFNYDGAVTLQGLTLLPDAVAHRFFVEAVDADGNWSAHMPFSLTESSPHRIAILEGHTRWLNSVSFSPDGSTLASGGDDQTVKLWNVVTQQDFGTLPHGARVTSVSFSPDGRLLASGAVDGAVKIWDVTTRQDVGTLLHGAEVTSVSFSRDGTTFASGSRDGTVKLWDVTTQQDIGTLPHGAGVTSVAFSRDGMLLASGSQDKTVKLWDVTARQEVGTLEGHSIWVYSVSFSPDESTLASTGGNTVKLWDVTKQQLVDILPHGADIGSVSFSRDGRTLASGAVDGTVKLWDVASGANFAVLGNTSGVNSVSFSSDGVTLASGTNEGTIELWDTSGLMREHLEAVAEIDIPDPNLRTAIATALGKPQSASIVRGAIATLTFLEAIDANIDDLTGLELAINLKRLYLERNNISDISALAGLIKLQQLSLSGDILDISALAELIELTGLYIIGSNISDISALKGLTKLRSLNLASNSVSDLSPVAELTDLTWVVLTSNNITDLSPLVENTGLGIGDEVRLHGNPLSYRSIYTHIPALQERGVEVFFDNRTPHRIRIVSGNNQQGLPRTALENPLVVEIQDRNGAAFEGVSIEFSVASSGGTLSVTSVTTNSNGRAECTLTLGPNPGTNTVTVSVTGITQTETFNAEGIRIPKTWEIISGENQQDLPGAPLVNPFVVEVRDQFDNPFSGAQVTFAVTSGGGRLSVTTATTDSNGRAESTLTLGTNPGTNTVTVSVTGIQEKQTFNAEGIRIPETLDIVSGNDQEGLPGAALENPFVVEVRDQSDKPLPGVQVTFSVSSGGGTLSATSVTTDSDGRAENTLTLGPNPGTNTVTVSVTGSQEGQTVTAEGIRVPKTLEIISGNDQEGLPGAALENPFVVEVRDQSDKPLPGVQVTFSVSSGGGTLSATSVTTDSNGRAENTLTLGPNPGTNTVTVSVTGSQEGQTVTAEGIRIPKTLEIISGGDQEGLPGAALENPFIVEVRDQTDKPLSGVVVAFSVTSGGGTLSATSVTTDSNGRAESTLTLGPNPGTNTVTVSVTGIEEVQTFTAEGIRIPLAFWIISGGDQQGQTGAALDNPFVVEVRDQSGGPLPGAQIAFSVSSGGGTLSATSATTDSNGRAESILTLGPNPGTNTVEVRVRGIQEKQSVSAIAELPPIPQDVNRDDVVNILDLVLVASDLGDEGTDLAADVNGDGIVNILDLVMVAGALGDAAAAPSAWYRDLEIAPTTADVGRWLGQAQGLDLMDATSQRGVLFLEQLLAVLTPKETALLPNYPNPFNPETWIPYRLAEDAAVTLTIYDTNGIMVRRLDVGHQLAGFYESQSQAIYWDARNGFGEGVASGVYFYHLSAGEYSATRRMLIQK